MTRHEHVTHLKTRSTSIALLRLNPGIQLSVRKEPAIKTVADFLNIGEDQYYQDELLLFMAPFLADYICELQMNYPVNLTPLWIQLGFRKEDFPLDKVSIRADCPHWEDLVALARPEVEKKGAGTVERFCQIVIDEEPEDRLLFTNRKVWEDFQRFWESHGALFFGLPRRGVVHYLTDREIRIRVGSKRIPKEGRTNYKVPDWFMALFEVGHPGISTEPEEVDLWQARNIASQNMLI